MKSNTLSNSRRGHGHTFFRGIALGVLALFLFASHPEPTHARDRGPGGQKPTAETMLAGMTRELELTADQQTLVKPIIEEHFQKMKALFQSSEVTEQGNRESVRTQMAQLKQAFHTKLAEVLTEEQLAKFQESIQNRRSRRPGREGGMRGMNPPR